MLRDADSGQIDHMAAEPTHGPHHKCSSSSWLGARGPDIASHWQCFTGRRQYLISALRLCCLCCLCNKLARHWSTPKTSPEGHDRRDVPRSCRARSPALHVGGRDRVASWSWSRTSHPHAHLHAQLGLISASAAPSAVIYHRHRHLHALEEPRAARLLLPTGVPSGPAGDGDEVPQRGPRAVCTTLADVPPVATSSSAS